MMAKGSESHGGKKWFFVRFSNSMYFLSYFTNLKNPSIKISQVKLRVLVKNVVKSN